MNGDAGGLTVELFFELWELYEAPVLTSAVAGALLGVLGVYVVLRRLVFLTAAVSQAAGLGVTLAFYARLHLGAGGLLTAPTTGAVLATLLAILVVMGGQRTLPAARDAMLGIVFLTGAAGTLVVGKHVVQELQDVHSLLFGTAVAVLPEDFHRMCLLAGGLLLLHLWWWRGFEAVSFDRDGARVRGLPVRLLDVTLFATLALAISYSTRVLGALPTFAFSVLPGIAAVRLAPNLPLAALLAGVLGAACGFGGYLLAFLYDLPVGAAQALLGVTTVAVLVPTAALLRRLVRPASVAGVADAA